MAPRARRIIAPGPPNPGGGVALFLFLRQIEAKFFSLPSTTLGGKARGEAVKGADDEEKRGEGNRWKKEAESWSSGCSGCRAAT